MTTDVSALWYQLCKWSSDITYFTSMIAPSILYAVVWVHDIRCAYRSLIIFGEVCFTSAFCVWQLRSYYNDLAVHCSCWLWFRDIFNDVTGDNCTRSCKLWKSLSLCQISVIQLSGDLHRHREDGLYESVVTKYILVFGLYICLKSGRHN